jgi:hypothetical protein
VRGRDPGADRDEQHVPLDRGPRRARLGEAAGADVVAESRPVVRAGPASSRAAARRGSPHWTTTPRRRPRRPRRRARRRRPRSGEPIRRAPSASPAATSRMVAVTALGPRAAGVGAARRGARRRPAGRARTFMPVPPTSSAMTTSHPVDDGVVRGSANAWTPPRDRSLIA